MAYCAYYFVIAFKKYARNISPCYYSPLILCLCTWYCNVPLHGCTTMKRPILLRLNTILWAVCSAQCSTHFLGYILHSTFAGSKGMHVIVTILLLRWVPSANSSHPEVCSLVVKSSFQVLGDHLCNSGYF